MCVTCMVTSALLLFTPSGGDLSLNSPRSLPLAQEAQVAITEVTQRIPASQSTQTLHSGLRSLQAKLATAKNDAEAKAILDQELKQLRDRIAVDPNASKINQVLENLVITDTPENSSSTPVQQKPKGWGWLK